MKKKNQPKILAKKNPGIKVPNGFEDFEPNELRVFARLNTPQKIQDYLDALKINFEEDGEDTCVSPRYVMKRQSAHCAEGALFAAAALWYHGRKPLLMDLKASKDDYDHVATLFQENGKWGALTKTNHAVLRYREPVYESPRELAMSYFHEYFNDKGYKCLRSFSEPFDLSKLKDNSWLTTPENLWEIVFSLDASRHHQLVSTAEIRNLRLAHPAEIEAGKILEWHLPQDNPKAEVRKAKFGMGLYAKEPIKKNEVIARFDGKKYRLQSRWNNDLADHCIEVGRNIWRDTKKEGIARYANHSCNPNCGIRNLIEIVAMRDIKSGEELTWDYEMTEDNETHYWQMKCKCGAKNCRKIIGAYRNMPESVRKKYKGYISEWLLKENIPAPK